MAGERDILLTTDRLQLVAPGPGHVEALHAIASDFDVVRHTATWPWPADRAVTETRCVPANDPARVHGLICHDGQVMGMIGADASGSLGYMLGRRAWGRGFATEIGRAFVAHVFATRDWPELSACVFQDNPASSRVLEKLGFAEGPACTGACAARGGRFPTRTFTLARPSV